MTLTRRLARDAGLFVGPSSGAALAGVSRSRAARRAASSSRSFPTAATATCRKAVHVTGAPARAPRRRCRSPTRVRDAIRAHAACVVSVRVLRRPARIRGRGHRGRAALRQRRRRAIAERRFLLSAADYRGAEARADATGRALLGFYHSHPDHPAEPSAFDLAHAWPNLSYVILSVRDGRPRRHEVLAARRRSLAIRRRDSGS